VLLPYRGKLVNFVAELVKGRVLTKVFAFCFRFCHVLQGQNFQYTPCKIPLKEKIVQVASGQSHILALTGA
jgi:alpha-tubulin suppressor-like RCC1 family protein